MLSDVEMSWFDHKNAETLKRHKRLQIFSYVATFTLTTILVLRTDWSVHSKGHKHIFGDLKPTLKSYLNSRLNTDRAAEREHD